MGGERAHEYDAVSRVQISLGGFSQVLSSLFSSCSHSLQENRVTSQNLQPVPSPSVLLVCPRSADAVLSLFFFLQLWAFIIQTIPFEFSLFRVLHKDQQCSTCFLFFFKAISKYLSNIKQDSRWNLFCLSIWQDSIPIQRFLQGLQSQIRSLTQLRMLSAEWIWACLRM